MTHEPFGILIQQILAEQNLSARAAGYKSGISGTYISDMANGRLPTEDTLRKFMAAIAPERTQQLMDAHWLGIQTHRFGTLMVTIQGFKPKSQVTVLLYLVNRMEEQLPGFIEALWPRLQRNFPVLRTISNPRNENCD